jgi:drug/metabolite transporter (DMT)-like permease
MLDLNKPLVQWLFLIFLAFTWGSSFILMKMGLQSFDNLQVACLRILISFIFLFPIMVKNLKKIKKDQWLNILIAGFLGSGIPAFLFTKAQTQISSSLTGMLNSLVPLFTVVIGLLFFGMSFRKLKGLGALVGLIGAIGLLSVNGGISISNDDFLYASLVVLATICYATNVNFIKTRLVEVSSLNITTFGFILIGPASGIYLFTTDFTTILQSDPDAWLNLFYIALLAVFGTAIAVILFNMLIKKVSPVFASSVTYIIPVFAIFWGIIDGEIIKPSELLFIAIILTGVYIINRDNRLERKEARLSAEKIT